MAHLVVTLGIDVAGVAVRWRLEGQRFDDGETIGSLPVLIAGAPTSPVEALVVTDDQGRLPVHNGVVEEAERGVVRVWRTSRPSAGPVEVSYLAPPVDEEPAGAVPPLELRREGAGLSGVAKCFLVLPPEHVDPTFELHCVRPPDAAGWSWVTSLGEAVDEDGVFEGAGLEQLGDTYVMSGQLTDSHVRDGAFSTWWLTSPPFDAADFTARLATTYHVMSDAFDAPAHPYRVFLRASPYHGHVGSAHPASFVITVKPDDPVDDGMLYGTLAHELVHEWVLLDGPPEQVTWFVEGVADYYSLVLPLRAGQLDPDDFLREVNLASRQGYANPLRHLHLDEASGRYWSDFRAHRLPYVRGMFYLADLEARLRQSTDATHSLDDLVREVVRRRRGGERVTVGDWCARITDLLGSDETVVLDGLVHTGVGRPGRGSFGPDFQITPTRVPVLDLGMDASTFLNRRVTGIVPGGPAALAGLEDGDEVELPRYSRALALNVDDVLTVRVHRGDDTWQVSIPLDSPTAEVPQWHR